MPSILTILQFVLLLTIIGLTMKTISMISESKTSRGFVLKSYLQTDDDEKENNLSTGFLERLFSYSKYKAHIEKELEDAHMDVSFNRFMIRRIVLALLFSATGLIMFAVTDMVLYLYATIPLGFVAYKIPKRNIKKNKTVYENTLKMELPEYLSAFAVLLQTYSPYEATKRSVEYAGPLTKPYVQELVAQVDLYPASPKPYDSFAKQIGLREMKEFMVALQQIMKVNSQDSDRIIKDQSYIMDQLQEEAYNEQLEERPEQVDKYNMAMLIPLLTVAVTFLFVLISDSFSNIM